MRQIAPPDDKSAGCSAGIDRFGRIGPRSGVVGMEPGGIEPPSRDSQQDASTRVVDRLISASHRGSTPCALAQPLVTSSLPRQEAPRGNQPDDRDPPPYRASRGGSEACVRPPLRTAVRQLWVCVLFTRPARPSTRHAEPSLSGRMPYRPQVVKEGPKPTPILRPAPAPGSRAAPYRTSKSANQVLPTVSGFRVSTHIFWGTLHPLTHPGRCEARGARTGSARERNPICVAVPPYSPARSP